jgi:Protein of unknown function (DUF2637)
VTRNDVTTRRLTTGIVLAVGLFAGGDSYAHVFSLARQHRQEIAAAALMPLAGDGLVLAASMVMLVASRAGGSVPLRARVLMAGGLVPPSPRTWLTGSLAGSRTPCCPVWAVAAYVGCMELLTWLRQNLGVQPKRTPATVPGTGTSTAGDELEVRRERRRQPLTDLLRAAETAFPGGLVQGGKHAGKLASIREIKSVLSVAQDRATQVQQYLKTLQASLALVRLRALRIA